MASAHRGIAVAVVLHDGRVLVGRRSAASPEAPGLDEFPGGKVEPGETSAAAATRECLEESGVAVRLLGQSCFVSTRAFGITFHWATPVNPALPPRPPFEWVAVRDLPGRRFPECNAPVLALLRAPGGSDGHGGS